MKGLASRCGSTARHAIDVLFVCANLLRSKQTDAISKMLSSRADFCIFQLSWDETKFRLVPSDETGRGKATDVSTLAAHGRLACSVDNCLREDEVVIAPVAMTSTSASCLWGACRAILPPCLWNFLCGDVASIDCDKVSINLGSDHASSNVKFIMHVIALAGENVFVLPGFCKQHASGLCISPIVKALGIACPCFCIAKLFRTDKFFRRVCSGIKPSLRKRLVWNQASAHPEWRPKREDVAYAELI